MKSQDSRGHHRDGVDRRGFLKCMAWAGSGVLYSASGGILSSETIPDVAGGGTRKAATRSTAADFTFVQISDSHIGFDKEANKDVVGTLQESVDRINSLPEPPDFVLHTGDLTHLSKPGEFDTIDQVLKGVRTSRLLFVPGEHDVIPDDGANFLERYGRETRGRGWYSFDHKGVHFIGLVNVLDFKPGGLGQLGPEQLDWLKADTAALQSSVPIVVFAHIPLWTIYPDWGWGTEDSAQALSHLKRFGSVTVLNGHIHQTMRKVEGNVTFHTAMSTAYPQPRPGSAPSPGPLKVPEEQLRGLLGLTSVNYVQANSTLAVIDKPLSPSTGNQHS